MGGWGQQVCAATHRTMTQKGLPGTILGCRAEMNAALGISYPSTTERGHGGGHGDREAGPQGEEGTGPLAAMGISGQGATFQLLVEAGLRQAQS